MGLIHSVELKEKNDGSGTKNQVMRTYVQHIMIYIYVYVHIYIRTWQLPIAFFLSKLSPLVLRQVYVLICCISYVRGLVCLMHWIKSVSCAGFSPCYVRV